MEVGLLKPSQLATRCGINKNTLNRRLDDADLFPPAKIEEGNSYRFYDEVTVKKLILQMELMKRPFRLKLSEIKLILMKSDISALFNLYQNSKAQLHKYMFEKGLL